MNTSEYENCPTHQMILENYSHIHNLKKVFQDSEDRQILFNCQGVNRKIRAIIQQTFERTTLTVRFTGEISNTFEINKGIRQADGLSPLLFNIVLEKMNREWEIRVKGIQIGKKKRKSCFKMLGFCRRPSYSD